MITRARVLAALSTVHDPELDEPITSLGFVGSCEVSDGGDVDVHLRLPTPQCAPNFAFLMASDAREAVLGVSGVRRVGVVLDDHYTAGEINVAVAGGGGFGAAFPGESAGDLSALRELFQRKALLARQGRVCDACCSRATRRDHATVAAMCVARPAGRTTRSTAASSCGARSACPLSLTRRPSSPATAARSVPRRSRSGCAARAWSG